MLGYLDIPTNGQGLYEFTADLRHAISESEVGNGMCFLFLQHTSASLIIQENADPSAKRDLERWLRRLVPESDRFEHQSEGPDDMPAHIKAALTNTDLAIPLIDGELALGTWQGIYLWEHRDVKHRRRVIWKIV